MFKMNKHQPLGYVFFDDNDYLCQKVRMVIYLQFIDYDLRLYNEDIPHKPTKIENDIMIP